MENEGEKGRKGGKGGKGKEEGSLRRQALDLRAEAVR